MPVDTDEECTRAFISLSASTVIFVMSFEFSFEETDFIIEFVDFMEIPVSEIVLSYLYIFLRLFPFDL